MFVVNILVALGIAVIVWYAASRGLAQFIVHTETRNPGIAGRPLWGAVSTLATFGVFIASVATWIGFTYLLDQFSH